MKHFISATCEGEKCTVCGKPATHKVGEEIPHDDPAQMRHNYTAYVCCKHFRQLFGAAVQCKEQELEAGDLVQLNPELVGNKAFAGCIMVVTEPKEWGAQGYVQALGESSDAPGGQAYIRVKWEEMELVGVAEWIRK